MKTGNKISYYDVGSALRPMQHCTAVLREYAVISTGWIKKMSERQTKAGNQECYEKLEKPLPLPLSHSLSTC